MKNKGKLVLGLVGLVLLLTLAVFLFKSYEISNLEEKAEEAYDLGEYGDAKIYYQQLKDRKSSPRYDQRIVALEELIQSKQYFETGKFLLEDGDLEGAINSLRLVSSEDEIHYKKARDLVNGRLDDFTSLAETYAEARDEDSLKEIKRKLDSFYGRSDVLGDIEIKEEIVEEEKEEPQEEAKEEPEVPIKGEAGRKVSSGYDPMIGQVVYTTAKKSNLRSGPGLNYSIVTHVSRGSTVEIFDAVYETERTWYRAYITSSVTYNTYDAWISSRNLK